MLESRRCLPNWIPDEKFVFVTWRLAGTIPESARQKRIEQARAERLEAVPVGRTVLPSAQSAGTLFAEQDRELDRATCGPLWLKDVRVAQMVVEALHYCAVQREFYNLHAFVVMPNH